MTSSIACFAALALTGAPIVDLRADHGAFGPVWAVMRDHVSDFGIVIVQARDEFRVLRIGQDGKTEMVKSLKSPGAMGFILPGEFVIEEPWFVPVDVSKGKARAGWVYPQLLHFGTRVVVFDGIAHVQLREPSGKINPLDRAAAGMRVVSANHAWGGVGFLERWSRSSYTISFEGDHERRTLLPDPPKGSYMSFAYSDGSALFLARGTYRPEDGWLLYIDTVDVANRAITESREVGPLLDQQGSSDNLWPTESVLTASFLKGKRLLVSTGREVYFATVEGGKMGALTPLKLTAPGSSQAGTTKELAEGSRKRRAVQL